MKMALKKYGKEAFTKEWLEFAENQEELNYLERMYVDEEWLARPDTYNIILGGTEGRKGPCTEEHKRKLSEAHKGLPPWNKGKHLTDEMKEKMSKAKKGIPKPNHHTNGIKVEVQVNGKMLEFGSKLHAHRELGHYWYKTYIWRVKQ